MDTMFTVVGGILLFGLLVLGGIVGAVVWGARKAGDKLTEGSRYEMPAYQHLDLDVGSTAEDISRVLDKCLAGDGVGKRAERTMRQMEDAQRKREAVKAAASGRYTRGDLGLDALTEVTVEADMAYDRLLRNCAGLANSAQTFDARDYHNLGRWRPGANRNSLDQGQRQRLADMEARLGVMDGILSANEELLLKLDRLVANLEWLECEQTAGAAAVDAELHGYRAQAGL